MSPKCTMRMKKAALKSEINWRINCEAAYFRQKITVCCEPFLLSMNNWYLLQNVKMVAVGRPYLRINMYCGFIQHFLLCVVGSKEIVDIFAVDYPAFVWNGMVVPGPVGCKMQLTGREMSGTSHLSRRSSTARPSKSNTLCSAGKYQLLHASSFFIQLQAKSPLNPHSA